MMAASGMTLGGKTVSSVAATALAPPMTANTPSTATTTKAKVFLGVSDIFTVSSSGAAIYGSTGADSVTISAGTTGVTLDQNIEQVNFSGASSSYTFKQTGNKINVYDSTGIPIVSAPVQDDSDGTQLSFSDGAASAMMTASGMTLGGKTVSSAAATTVLNPVLR